MYAGDMTEGNILLNTTTSSSWLFLLGRIGCGTTMVLAMPMMLLPCRDCILKFLINRNNDPADVATEHTFLLHRRHDAEGDTAVAVSTLAIVAITYLGAVLAPGVAVVWSLCGSSMAFLISFLLPAACYLEIQGKASCSHDNEYRTFSAGLVIFSWVGATACTLQTVLGIINGSSL